MTPICRYPSLAGIQSLATLACCAAENYEPQEGRAVYRFFELFDLPNISGIENTLRASAEGRIIITPPIKPYLEEKMWFALFWMQPLREFWRRELGEKYFIKLQEVIPYSWLLDPMPLPQHAVIPRLEIHDWREAAKFSQKDRDLLLKVSGFSPLGGAAGVSRSVPTFRMRNGKSESTMHLRHSIRYLRSCNAFTKAACSIISIGIQVLTS